MRFILELVVDVVVKDDKKVSRTTFLQGWCLIGLLPFYRSEFFSVFPPNKILSMIMSEQNSGQSRP
jgi:hypothetical protein